MVVYDSTDSENLIKTLENNIKSANAIFQRLTKGSEHLIGVIHLGTLSGAAYEAGKSLFETYIVPMIRQLSLAIEDMEADLSSYIRADKTVKAYDSHLDKSLLERHLENTKELIRQVEQKIESDRRFIQNLISFGLEGAFEAYSESYVLQEQLVHLNELKRTYEENLAGLETFMATTAPLFTDSLEAFQYALQGVSIINQSTADMNGKITFPAGADMSWLKQMQNQAFGQTESPEFEKILEEQFDFDEETSEIIANMESRIKSKYPDKSDQEVAYLMSRLLGGLTYSDFQWDSTAGEMTEREVLESLGYSSEEIEKLFESINNQHDGVSGSGKADFSHQMITTATILREPGASLAGIGTLGRRQEAAGWLGDVSEIAMKPNMDNADYKADLDAVNISERVKESGGLRENMNQYYSELSSGKTNRAEEFQNYYSVDDIIISINQADQTGINETSYFEDKLVTTVDNSQYSTLSETGKNFVDSIKKNSNDYLGDK